MRKLLRSSFITVLLGFFTIASAQLPPKIQADKHLIFAEQLYEAKDYAGAFAEIKKAVALQQEHGIDLSDKFHFRYAQIALSVDSTQVALEQVGKYLSATGDAGEHYEEALALLLKAEGHVAKDVGDFYEDVINVEGTCEGLRKGSSCWQKLDNHPQCYVWNPSLTEGEIATWTGICEDYRPDGKGTLRRYLMGKYTSGKEVQAEIENFKGHFQKGKMWEGQWHKQTYFSVDPYDAEHGTARRSTDSRASFVNGKRHGKAYTNKYILTEPRPSEFYLMLSGVHKFNYENGKIHGPYFKEEDAREYHLRRKYVFNKIRTQTHYVDGKKHGNEKRFRHQPNSGYPAPDKWYNLAEESFYVYGEKHGEGKKYWGYPTKVEIGYHVEGEMHGEWESFTDKGERIRITSYVYGKRHAYYEDLHGKITEGLYVDDKKHGQWIIRTDYGAVGGGSYVNGKQHGPWFELFYFRDGGSKGEYVNGEREGKWIEYSGGKCRNYWYKNDEKIKEDGIRKKNCREAGLIPPEK